MLLSTAPEKSGHAFPYSSPIGRNCKLVDAQIRRGSHVGYRCEKSRCMLAKGEGASTLLMAAGCGRNDCPYCGRKKMYQKRNRINDRLKSDQLGGIEAVTRSLFVTSTIREGVCTPGDSLIVIKTAWAYAVKALRRSCDGSRGAPAWTGLELEHIGDVDIQPQTDMGHVHALTRLRPAPGCSLPSERAIARRLGYYYNRRLSQLLGKPVLSWEKHRTATGAIRWGNPYREKECLGYVHIGEAADNQAVVNYMALHNGKIWTDGRQYPTGYRRFSTSRGFLPPQYQTEKLFDSDGAPVMDRQKLPMRLIETSHGAMWQRPDRKEWPIVQKRKRIPTGSGWKFVRGRSLDQVIKTVNDYNQAVIGASAVQWERDDPFASVDIVLMDKKAGLPSLVALGLPVDTEQVQYWLWGISPLEVTESGLTYAQEQMWAKYGIDRIADGEVVPEPPRGSEWGCGTARRRKGGKKECETGQGIFPVITSS